MVTGAKDLLPEMARDRLSEGLRVIFDQDFRSNSGSRSISDSSDSGNGSRTRDTCRGRHRSSSTSSSTSSLSNSSRPRSRSHPRCHRNLSRCRCATHYRKAHGHRRHRSPQRSRAHSRSCSPASPVRSNRRRNNRSRSRSKRTSRGFVGHDRLRVSKSSKSYHSRSRSSRRSATSPTLDEKELLKTEKENATKVPRVDLPECVNPILDEPSQGCPTAEPQAWVRPEAVPEKAPSQNSDMEPDDFQRSKVSPIRRIITFSIHNSVAKPTVAPVASAKVTPRVDGIESRKPYGHWVPVGRGALKHKRSSR